MTKWKKPDLIVLHNNLANRKGVPYIFDGSMMEICDAIERVNNMPDRKPGQRATIKPTESLRTKFTRFVNTPITQLWR